MSEEDSPVETVERGNVSITGGLDLTNTSYYDPEQHGQTTNSEPNEPDGESMNETESNDDDSTDETIAGTSDDDLHEMETEMWPEGATDSTELTEDQRAVIRAAVMNPDFEMFTELTKLAGVDRSTTFPSTVLRDHWPDKHAEKSSVSRSIPNSEIEGIRRRALSGESSSEIADEYGFSRSTITNRIAGRVGDDSESEIPPLEWDNPSQSYVIPDGEDDTDGPETAGEEDSDMPTLDGLLTRTETDDTDDTDNSRDHEPATGVEISGPTDLEQARTAGRAIAATATHEETVDAVEHLLEILGGS